MYPFFDLIPRYFPELSSRQKDLLLMLWDFYHDWNSKINVISRKDVDELYLRHVLHSLSIARFFRFDRGSMVLDIGTGGGFPGIPLSIFFDNVHVVMVDSIGKKIKIVNEAIRHLQLGNASAYQARAEDLKQRFDFIVCRAVADISELVGWTGNLINQGKTTEGITHGLICLKGGELTAELNKVTWEKKIYDISSVFQEEFFQTKKVVHLWKK